MSQVATDHGEMVKGWMVRGDAEGNHIWFRRQLES